MITRGYFSSIHSRYTNHSLDFSSVESLNKEIDNLALARDSNDVSTLINLMDSKSPVTIEEDVKIHEWAENPKTIGALATIQIAIIASDPSKNYQSYFLDIVNSAGLVDKLILQFSDKEKGKADAAVLAISFLSETPIVEELVNKNVIAALKFHIKDPREGMRSCVCSCCRNLYVGRPLLQREFVWIEGCECLFSLLDSSDESIIDETLFNMFDLLIINSGIVMTDIQNYFQRLGLCQKLGELNSTTTGSNFKTDIQNLLDLFD